MSEPLANLSFLPWVRHGVAAGLNTADALSGQPGAATVDVALTLNADPPISVTAQLRGPADVVGLDVHQVIRMEPQPGSTDFEPNHFASVEFDRPDLPWLFTPLRPGEQARLRPWLCLVVVARGEGVALTPPGAEPLPQLQIGAPASPAEELPDPTEAWAWAHAQVVSGAGTASAVGAALNGGPELSLSRLVCPRRLEPNTDYLACVVPTFEIGRKAGLGVAADPAEVSGASGLAPAWSLTPQPPATQPPATVTLPVYHSWSFRTGEAGDFASLAERLTPRRPPDRLGLRPAEIAQPGFALPAGFPASAIVDVPGVLQPADAPETTPAWPTGVQAPFQSALAGIVNAPGPSEAADPVLAPPLYGRWYAARATATPGAAPWFDDLNLDPRWRSAAASGVRVVQEYQEALMASAWRQAADLREANQRVRQLQLSLTVGLNLHARHLERLDPAVLLRVAAPVFGRIRTPVGSDPQPKTLIAQMAGGAVPVAAASAAMRRIGRARGPLTRRTVSQGVTRVAVGGWINILNGGPVALAKPAATGPATIGAVLARMGGPPGIRAYADVNAALVAAAPPTPVFTVAAEGQPVDVAAPPPGGHFTDTPSAKAFRAAAVAHLTRLDPSRTTIMVNPPQLLDLPGLRATILSHLNPSVTLTALAKAVIAVAPSATQPTGTPASAMTGLDGVMMAPRFTQPMYEPLRDLSQDLMLAGLEQVHADTVLGLKTNRRFVEAYMVGLNDQMGAELLWRGFPTDQRGTYFDQFWDARGAASPQPDIAPPTSWANHPLGGSPAAAQSDQVERFVLLVRSALLLRYPNAVIYAVRAVRTDRGRVISDDPTDEAHPIFTGAMSPDVAFFGFGLAAEAVTGADGSEGFYLVIQEHPTEPRFGLEADAPAGRLSALGQPPEGTPLRGLTWGRNAAHMASITRRLPVRVAIHGSRFTPQAGGPHT